MMQLEKYCENWQKARIAPKQKEVEKFIKERTRHIQKLMSTANTRNHQKALTEEKHLKAVIALDEEYQEFVKSVQSVVWQCLQQYAVSINEGAEVFKVNQFLRERLATMDEREVNYLDLLRKMSEK